MARARNIKPSFFQNELLGELTPLERLAFIGMWTIADFKGCIEFRPKRLKVQLLPYDECDFDLIAINLDKSGLIRMYSVQGKRYIKIVNFEKHQNPHKNERDAGSDIPDFEEKYIDHGCLEYFEKNREQDGTARADSLFLIPDSLTPSPSGDVGVVLDLSLTDKNPVLISTTEGPFEEFWRAYPKKVGKEDARRAWGKIKSPAATLALIHAALEWQKKSEQWQKENGQYIPNPSTYLNQGRWMDEPPQQGPPPSLTPIGKRAMQAADSWLESQGSEKTA